MHEQLDPILEALPEYGEKLRAAREVVLANTVMLGECPSPTFGEQERIQLLSQRFTESGLADISIDEIGNCAAILPGRDSARNVAVVAHVDTALSADVDHSVSILPDRVQGRGLCDNGLGVAVLASLPDLFKILELPLESNLLLLGDTRSLGRGNLEGIRFFLDNNKLPVQAGVCLEAVQLGRLSLESIGMLRGEIVCQVPEAYDWTRFGAAGAITSLNEVINRILEIPVPRRPRTSIVFGSLSGGSSYSTVATEARLRFEIRSESGDMADHIRQKVELAVSDVASRTGADVSLDLFASRHPGGIDVKHPLAAATRAILTQLGLDVHLSPSTSELCEFIEHGIPAVTVGLTEGDNLTRPDEMVMLDPMATGLAQLIGLLLAIDRGCCDAE